MAATREPSRSRRLATRHAFRAPCPTSLLLFAGFFILPASTASSDPTAVTFKTGRWAGIDGNWSTFGFNIGEPPQQVDVLASTSLSEFWAVGTTGCLPREPMCSSARGGLYAPEDSDRLYSLGIWKLGLEYLGTAANGQYGLDRLASVGSVTDGPVFDMTTALSAAINTTDYFLGSIGLGITQGNFGGTVAESPLTQAVSSFALIPSYSYGYTAGAHYSSSIPDFLALHRFAKMCLRFVENMPGSLTWGGYDLSRFEDHDETFALGSSDGGPQVLVRGIEVGVGQDQEQPEGWDSSTSVVSNWDEKFTAIIDSTTPFLWLPNRICDNIAEALNLTYNDDFQLYTISNDQYHQLTDPDMYSFVFSLSSTANTDNFGDPLNTAGVVNITLPSEAFVSTLQYPFMDEAIQYGDPAVPYFSLRKSGTDSLFIIGRSFLQESYLVTQYDRALFSIHQAKFPENPSGDADIHAIEQPPNSPYPGPNKLMENRGLSKPQLAGIVVGAVAAVFAALFGLWYFRRKRARRKQLCPDGVDPDKIAGPSPSPEDEPKISPVARILTMITRRPRKWVGRTTAKSGGPSEVPNHEIYELPVPIPPAELSGEDDRISAEEEARFGLEPSQHLSSYEQAQRRIDRQLAGPVPEYSPPASGNIPPPEKPDQEGIPTDGNPLLLRHQPSSLAPVSPAGPDSAHSGSINSAPSPLSPRGDWTNRFAEVPLPSPITATAPQLPVAIDAEESTDSNRSGQQTDDSRTGSQATHRSTSDRSHSSTTAVTAPPRGLSIQRTPIDPSRVVYLGRLPSNAQLRSPVSIPRIIVPDTPRNESPPYQDDDEESLGSNYTEEEEKIQEMVTRMRMQEMQAQGLQPLPDPGIGPSYNPGHAQARGGGNSTHISRQPDRAQDATSRNNDGCIDGSELIHVPQMAEKRYSWEEER